MCNALVKSQQAWLVMCLSLAVFTFTNIVAYTQRCLHLRDGMKAAQREEFLTQPMQHVVIICAYKEPMEVLRKTLRSIVSQESIVRKPIIVLAMECKDPGRHEQYAKLEEEFASQCQEMMMTEHLLAPGEV